MSLTLANAITQVRYTLNETAAAYWTDEEITAWIQEGCRVFSSKTLMAEGSDNITLIANQLSYTDYDESFISVLLEPYSAIYYDGTSKYKGLIKIEPKQIGNLATFTAGSPKYYCVHARAVYVFPLTSAAVVAAGGIITMLYAAETDNIVTLKDEYQHLPIVYATARAKQKDQHYGEASALLAQFYQEINFERQDKHNREKDSLESFKVRKGQ